MSDSRLQHGGYYHLYHWGNHKEPIFRNESDYHYFLDLYRKYIHQLADLYAYCLLPTHFQFVVLIKNRREIDPMYADHRTLWTQFRRFLGTYTKEINHRSGRRGHLFAGRVSRIQTDQDGVFYDLISNIHKDPETHGLVMDYRIWPFSSYYAYSRRDRRSLLARKLFTDDELYYTILRTHQRQTFSLTPG